jgi:serine protease Do
MNKTKFTILLIILAIISGFIGGMLTNNLAIPLLVQYGSKTTQENGDVSVIQPVKLQVVNEDSQIIEAIEKVSPSVVSIVVTKDLQIIKANPYFVDDPFFFFDPFSEDPFEALRNIEGAEIQIEKQKVGGGTGFIFTEDGLIITNKHVVEDDKAQYTVILNNGDEYPAEVVDKDTFNDIAVVRLLPNEDDEKPENLPVVTLGDSKKLKVGQRVIAIGNALTEFENTVTVGVVSAKERTIIASDMFGRGENLTGLIQTDAAINPGNSGGPLINLAGEVIGVNTAIASGANSLGFAIPVNDVATIIESVKEVGRIVRPVLGVRYIQLDEKIAEEYAIEGVTEGALLIGNVLNKEFAVVPDQPADKAGLKENDVITEIEGKKVTKENTLRDIVSQYRIGNTLSIRFYRDGEQRETSLLLEEVETE